MVHEHQPRPERRRVRSGPTRFLVTLVVVIVSGVIGPGTARSDFIDDAEASWAYVWGLRDTGWGDVPDASRLDLAITHFDVLMTRLNLNQSEMAGLRFTRAVAAYIGNKIRIRNGQPVDTEQANLALDDFNFVIDFRKNAPAGVDVQSYADATYYAGHLAYDVLNSNALAGRYWLQCADEGHAGCMNTVAFGYFTGDLAFEQDIGKSIEWHEKVFDSGTQYDCAGGFSALELAWLKTFQPQYDSRYDWQSWLDQAIAMHESLVGERYGPNPCYLSAEYVDAYVLALANGSENRSWLDRAIAINGTALDTSISQYFLGSGSRAAVDAALQSATYSSKKCMALLQLIVRARVLELDTEMAAYLQALNQLGAESCPAQIVWVSLLDIENAGP